MIYLDYNATTPIDPQVAEVMLPFLKEHFGNPSSIHQFGKNSKIALEKSRRQVAELLNCKSKEIVFTSGGTESNNLALIGYALAHRNEGNHIITSQIEHPAIIEVCKHLHSIGFEITYIPVDKFGMIDSKDVRNSICSKTILISIMHANNEVGTIQPIEEVAKIADEKGICFHTDAAQSLGKIPIDVQKVKVKLLSIAGHKIYAPKGIGALYVKDGTRLQKILQGAGQENGLRPGTENILEIVGLGKACELIKEDQHSQDLMKLRDKFYQGLSELTRINLNGHPEKRLPNTLNICFEKLDAAKIDRIFSKIAVSASAACHSESIKISPVLKAMKIPLSKAKRSIRFSVGRFTTSSEIEQAIKIISGIINEAY